jgi:hypothetical protein
MYSVYTMIVGMAKLSAHSKQSLALCEWSCVVHCLCLYGSRLSCQQDALWDAVIGQTLPFERRAWLQAVDPIHADQGSSDKHIR